MVKEQLAEIDPEILTADGFEDALVGYVEGWHPSGERYLVALYDRNKCIEVMVTRDGMTHEEAEEFFDFNVAGSYVGPKTPAFATFLE